jgi:hypothetical protein
VCTASGTVGLVNPDDIQRDEPNPTDVHVEDVERAVAHGLALLQGPNDTARLTVGQTCRSAAEMDLEQGQVREVTRRPRDLHSN